ncbi:MAG TPA: transcription antitermination factor NusB [Bacilli bacterium]|nr:transcription antitermination factor NusB [Bacilli bacterium]
MSLPRNQQHYIIMTIIYDELVDFSTNISEMERDARELISEMCDQPYDEVDDFIKNVVILSLTKYGIIRDAYIPYLKSWKWERLPLLTQAILLMSYAHYYFVEKSDKRVVIDVAVNLAKKYIDIKQSQFINAILDGVLK